MSDSSSTKGGDDFKSQWNRPLEAFLPPLERPSEREEMALRSRLEELVNKVRTYHPDVEEELLLRAFELGYELHRGQRRKGGEPYLSHPLEVAHLLTEIQADEPVLAAALLHDTLEDCAWQYEKAIQALLPLWSEARQRRDREAMQHLEGLRSQAEAHIADLQRKTRQRLLEEMGEEVLRLVEGVSRLTQLESRSEVRDQVENLRRLLLATASDVRVLFIKFADRLHNMRTLYPLPPERRLAIARETERIYAPLAHRLGLWRFKWELEDLALQVLYPHEYRQIQEWVSKQYRDRSAILERAIQEVRQRLQEEGIVAEVSGRTKHLYSIFQKMRRDGRRLEQILDIIAIRIIVETKIQCYQALGVVHSLWPHMTGQFYDYIANPKPNNYQSIHTKVHLPGIGPLEVQIRTREMHENAEYGIAAHWRYKARGKVDEGFAQVLAHFRQLIESLGSAEESERQDLFNQLAEQLLSQTIFVFTPRGDVVSLPVGSTPVDFAYAIHTELGHECVGAKVNGQLRPLNYELKMNDEVEIIRRRGSRPSADWLLFVKTPHARASIRSYLKRLSREEHLQSGREALEREASRRGLSLAELLRRDRELIQEHARRKGKELPPLLDRVAQRLSYKSSEDLLAALGSGDQSPEGIMNRIQSSLFQLEQELGRLAGEALSPKAPPSRPSGGEKGKSTYAFRLAQCCHPMPGDDIMAYITRWHGMTLHRADCSNLQRLREKEPYRIQPAQWEELSPRLLYTVPLRIRALDRVGLLRDITTVIASEGLNILEAQVRSPGNPMAIFFFLIEVPNREKVDTLVARLREKVREISEIRIMG